MLQHTYRGCAGTELRHDRSSALQSRLLNPIQSRSVRILTVRVSRNWSSCRTQQRRPRNSKEHRVNLIQEQTGLSTTCQKKRSAVTAVTWQGMLLGVQQHHPPMDQMAKHIEEAPQSIDKEVGMPCGVQRQRPSHSPEFIKHEHCRGKKKKRSGSVAGLQQTLASAHRVSDLLHTIHSR